MNTYSLKLIFLLCLGAIIFTSGTALAFDRENDATLMKTNSTPKIKVLPREMSKTLQVNEIPTSIPTPLIIGTSWNCYIDPIGIDHCHQILVICTDDQSSCTTIEWLWECSRSRSRFYGYKYRLLHLKLEFTPLKKCSSLDEKVFFISGREGREIFLLCVLVLAMPARTRSPRRTDSIVATAEIIPITASLKIPVESRYYSVNDRKSTL